MLYGSVNNSLITTNDNVTLLSRDSATARFGEIVTGSGNTIEGKMQLFRSETMQYFKIVIPKINAVTIMSAIETIGKIHFVDRTHHSSLYKNAYTDQVKKCSELLA